MLQIDTTGLTSENGDLKLRLQTIEQQVRMQDGKVFVQVVLFLHHKCEVNKIMFWKGMVLPTDIYSLLFKIYCRTEKYCSFGPSPEFFFLIV